MKSICTRDGPLPAELPPPRGEVPTGQEPRVSRNRESRFRTIFDSLCVDNKEDPGVPPLVYMAFAPHIGVTVTEEEVAAEVGGSGLVDE